MTGPGALVIQGDARSIPLSDASVDLIVTSPPYFNLRSYSDGGERFEGQIGSEHTWQEYLDALIECTREFVRVLKPAGSMWIVLGDKYSGGGGGGGGSSDGFTGRHPRPSRKESSIPTKSLMLLPHRYAIRCVEELGLIVRQDQVWSKPNSLPESVSDRTRRSHEYLFHLVKSERYYSAVDLIRTPHAESWIPGRTGGRTYQAMKAPGGKDSNLATSQPHPLGALPGSVWEVAARALNVPDSVAHRRCCGGQRRDGCEDGLSHYAAFPFALVTPIILGWSPCEVCAVCGEGRRPVVDCKRPGSGALWSRRGKGIDDPVRFHEEHTTRELVGYQCACHDDAVPTRPGVVLDPFGGTATAPLVAVMHGRVGISMDMSWDYCDLLARWRTGDPRERARAVGAPAAAVARIGSQLSTQGSLFDEVTA